MKAWIKGLDSRMRDLGYPQDYFDHHDPTTVKKMPSDEWFKLKSLRNAAANICGPGHGWPK
jgi:hypothetical protein